MYEVPAWKAELRRRLDEIRATAFEEELGAVRESIRAVMETCAENDLDWTVTAEQVASTIKTLVDSQPSTEEIIERVRAQVRALTRRTE